MTNEKKAREIGTNWYNAKCCGVPMDSDRVAEQAALEMAEWKEQQMIENAIKWMASKFYNEIMYIDKSIVDNFINDFKKAMKGK